MNLSELIEAVKSNGMNPDDDFVIKLETGTIGIEKATWRSFGHAGELVLHAYDTLYDQDQLDNAVSVADSMANENH